MTWWQFWVAVGAVSVVAVVACGLTTYSVCRNNARIRKEFIEEFSKEVDRIIQGPRASLGGVEKEIRAMGEETVEQAEEAGEEA